MSQYKLVSDMDPAYHEHRKMAWRESKRKNYIAKRNIPASKAISTSTHNQQGIACPTLTTKIQTHYSTLISPVMTGNESAR